MFSWCFLPGNQSFFLFPARKFRYQEMCHSSEYYSYEQLFCRYLTQYFSFFPSKVILAVLSVFSIMYHIFLMITPSMVRMILRSRSLHQSDLPLEEMGKHFELGDWKLLYILSRNMEPLVFGEFIRELYKAIKEARGKNATSAKLLSKA